MGVLGANYTINFKPFEENDYAEKNVLFLFSQSYYETTKLLLDTVKKTSCENAYCYLFPLMFCFRHYVELSLKRLIYSVNNDTIVAEHDLVELVERFCRNNHFNQGVNERIKVLVERFEENYERINNKTEVELYRYGFNKEFEIKQQYNLNIQKIEIDLSEIKKMFDEIMVPYESQMANLYWI